MTDLSLNQQEGEGGKLPLSPSPPLEEEKKYRYDREALVSSLLIKVTAVVVKGNAAVRNWKLILNPYVAIDVRQ